MDYHQKRFLDALAFLPRPLLASLLTSAVLAGLLPGCATPSPELKRTASIAGLRCCIKHRIPLISVRGFTVKPTLLVHCGTERCAECDGHTPNRIADRDHLYKTHIHRFRAIVSYCSLCEAEFEKCIAETRLAKEDLTQITAVVARRPDVREPILRIITVNPEDALVDTGAEQRIGDVFNEFVLSKERGVWRISSPIFKHQIIAVGK